MAKKRCKKAGRAAPRGKGAGNRFELGTLSVDDPEAPGSHIRAVVNIRHDVLLHWRARKQIDDVQYLAGQKLQALWYRAGTGLPATSHFDRERVDGGVRADPLSEQAVAASAELRQIAAFLGRADYRLATRALCEGQAIEDLACDVEGREPQRYIARRLRDALSYLADFWGTAGPGNTRNQRSRAGQGPCGLISTGGSQLSKPSQSTSL